MSQTAPPIVHQRHTDRAAAVARVRNALRDCGGSVPTAAAALGCSAGFLRAWLDAEPDVGEGIPRKTRGWTKGRKRLETKG